MISRYKNRILPAAAAVLALCASCADDDLVKSPEYGLDSRCVYFDLSTPGSSYESRASFNDMGVPDNSTVVPHEPLVARSDDGEATLYLHSYTRDRDESDAIAARGTQVGTVDPFIAGDNTFETHSRYVDGSVHFDATSHLYQQGVLFSPQPRAFWPADPNKEVIVTGATPIGAANITHYASGAENSGEDYVAFSYSIPAQVTSQVDLMISNERCTHNTAVDRVAAPVKLKHALAAVKFNIVKDVVDGVIKTITVKDVIGGTGTCVYRNDAFSWSGGSRASYTIDVNSSTNRPDQDNGTEETVLAGMETKTLLVMPQTLDDTPTVEIVFERDAVPDGSSLSWVPGVDKKTFTLHAKLKTTEIPKWEAGKEYVYTLSTKPANEIYVWRVRGSFQKAMSQWTTANPDDFEALPVTDSETDIAMNGGVTCGRTINEKYQGPYYKVWSYKFRANNPDVWSPIPWTAELSYGVTQLPDASQYPEDYNNLLPHYNSSIDVDAVEYGNVCDRLSNNKWFTEGLVLSHGGGRWGGTEFDFTFAGQRSGTTWGGDWTLRENAPHGTAETPWRLDNDKQKPEFRESANCYVVNAAGHYRLPCVPGNSLKGWSGFDEGTLTFDCTGDKAGFKNMGSTGQPFPALEKFTDYTDAELKAYWFSGIKDAVLVWEDALGIIGEVKLSVIYGLPYLDFEVLRDNLQQGNAVVAIRDNDGRIIWSWHIWVVEHWNNDLSTTYIGDGDVDVDYYHQTTHSGKTYKFAPYNLGWCDAKNVWLFERKGTMNFTQAETGATATLNVTQRPHRDAYAIGNNTYYQWGRKDPFVGFKGKNSQVKFQYGPAEYHYAFADQFQTIGYTIRNPHLLVAGYSTNYDTLEGSMYQDWHALHYYNLWNNYQGSKYGIVSKWGTVSPPAVYDPTNQKSNASYDDEYCYEGVKTVYDPCPVGYMVPPAHAFITLTNNNHAQAPSSTATFNGDRSTIGSDGLYRYELYGKPNKQGGKLIFYSTGHRWYTNAQTGSNSNGEWSFAWSNCNTFVPTATEKERSALGLAIGVATNGTISDCHFKGARAMARPIRPVRELHPYK